MIYQAPAHGNAPSRKAPLEKKHGPDKRVEKMFPTK